MSAVIDALTPTHVARPSKVHAHTVEIVELRHKDFGVNREYDLSLDSGELVTLTTEQLGKSRPRVGDYVVLRDDGRKKLIPKDDFERKYEPIQKGKAK